MKLSECKMGQIVFTINLTTGESKQVGMVIGISENCLKEAVPYIQWQHGGKSAYHHNDLKRYEE